MRVNLTIIVLTLLIVTSILLIPCTKAAVEPTVIVDPSFQEIATASVGETVKVDIKIDNVDSLWSWCISNLTFNPNIVNLTSIEEGPFLKKGGSTLFIWTSNSPKLQNGTVPEISNTLLVNNSVAGSGVIAILTFKVVSAGTSQISLNSTQLLTPYELTPNADIVTGVYQPINCTSSNGTLSINAVTAPVELMPLYAGIVVAAIVAAAIAIIVLKRKRS